MTNLRRFLIHFAWTAASALLIDYAACAFVQANFNPFSWPQDQRIALVAFWIFLGGFASLLFGASSVVSD